MAKEKELTVEERLKLLYQLQSIHSEVDRIKNLRGELPLEVGDLEDAVQGLKTRISNFDARITDLKTKIAQCHRESEEAKSLIAKYENDQNNVRNNREYDALSKEIEYTNLVIEHAEKKTRDANRAIEEETARREEAVTQLEDAEHTLADKRIELDEIVSETKQDEENLREKIKKLENKFDDQRLLTAFKRIRKNARNGLGLVYVQRNACGGCFNRIPAQRHMEIKMHKKIIVCEYCGRILIDPELVGISNEDAKNKD